jgi:hypothetical protein
LYVISLGAARVEPAPTTVIAGAAADRPIEVAAAIAGGGARVMVTAVASKSAPANFLTMSPPEQRNQPLPPVENGLPLSD